MSDQYTLLRKTGAAADNNVMFNVTSGTVQIQLLLNAWLAFVATLFKDRKTAVRRELNVESSPHVEMPRETGGIKFCNFLSRSRNPRV